MLVKCTTCKTLLSEGVVAEADIAEPFFLHQLLERLCIERVDFEIEVTTILQGSLGKTGDGLVEQQRVFIGNEQASEGSWLSTFCSIPSRSLLHI